MKKLTVLFDSEFIGCGLNQDATRSGIFFVAYNIAKRMLRDGRVELFFYSRPEVKGRIARYMAQEFECDMSDRVFVEGDDLSAIDYFLSPCLVPPAYVRRFPRITCFTVVHDVIPLLFPQYFTLPIDNSWFMDLVENINGDDFYFTVSECTKRDLVKHVPAVDERKVTVIRLAADERFYPDKNEVRLREVKEKYRIPADKKYVFSLCTLEPRKNLIRAVKAFVAFIEKNKADDLYYVLGGGAWVTFIGQLEKNIPNFSRYADRIIQAGYVADNDLSTLYSNAEWFVYTSQYEGFGLPPLEAMRCGCPVIVSNNSSLPEVVGDAGIMIDYDSVEQHVQAYESYYYNPALRERNAQRGVERTRQFSWNGCVDTIVDCMLELERRKQQKPLVTVVTVTYNLLKSGRKKLIRQCIESVHSQTYPNIEHIIIDGASTDGTRELLEDYARKGWVTLYSEPDKGIYDAMNKGIAKANGLYVNFLNSDDYFHDEQGIAVSVEQLMKCDADYSFADTRMTQGKGKYSLWKGDISKLLIGVHYCHQTMLVKTEALRRIGGFDLSYPVSADSDMMIRLYALGYRHTYVPYCFLTYQKGGFSGENKAQSRIDHATAFFRHIGSRVGLTLSDCFLLWQQRFFEELPFDKRLRLIAKVPAEFGAEDLMKQIITNPHSEEYMIPKQQLQFYLFGFIPLLSRKYRRNKTYYRLFNILRIMKKVEYNNKRKYYLFGFLPVWKVKVLK